MSVSNPTAPVLTQEQQEDAAYYKERAQSVAREIARQLGNMCLQMLGAKHLTSHGSTGEVNPALSFHIQGSEKVNYLKISLTPMDYYRMEFGRIDSPGADFEYHVVYVAERVCFDNLHALIEEHTGLYTSL